MKEQRQVKTVSAGFETREDSGTHVPHIIGYFARYDDIYGIAPGMTESIAKGAFTASIDTDIKALVNHDTTLVLGRTTAGTLKLKEDDLGLWGDITINTADRAAMDLYERVKRGDVNQCSFGFEIVKQQTEVKPNGDVHWTLTDVNLYEVSVCTFPAYKNTNVQARSAERDMLLRERMQTLPAGNGSRKLTESELREWKQRMKAMMKGVRK